MTPVWFDESGLAAIDPGAFARVVARLRSRAAMAASPELAAKEPQQTRTQQRFDAVAVIPVHGVITKRASMWADLFGDTTLDDLQAQLAAVRDDASVRAVLLHVDSPGGGVYGVDESAHQIAELNKTKPVIAFTDGLAASAAYWLASGASRIVASRDAEVGSIGVYAVHFDQSGALAQAGIVPTLVKAGEFKAEANPYQPLSEEDRDAMQARIDTHYTRFVSRVARNRGRGVDVVREQFGRGRIVDAAAALDVGMVTDIGTVADALRIAIDEARQRTPRQTQARACSDDLLRLQLQLEDVAT